MRLLSAMVKSFARSTYRQYSVDPKKKSDHWIPIFIRVACDWIDCNLQPIILSKEIWINCSEYLFKNNPFDVLCYQKCCVLGFWWAPSNTTAHFYGFSIILYPSFWRSPCLLIRFELQFQKCWRNP